MLGDDRLTAETSFRVVVDHSGSLHVGIDDRRTDELETALFQILAQSIGLQTGGRIIFQ